MPPSSKKAPTILFDNYKIPTFSVDIIFKYLSTLKIHTVLLVVLIKVCETRSNLFVSINLFVQI